MNLVWARDLSRDWIDDCASAWDRFWFAPRLPHTLALLRIVTGIMLTYSHLVLATDLSAFLGDHAWINNETARTLHDGAYGVADWGRSYLWHLSNPLLLWGHHLLTILVTLAFAAGFMTRLTAPAAWFLQLMYLHRLTGMLFGFDQILTYSVMYLMLSPCGSVLSVDAWMRKRFASARRRRPRLRWLLPEASPSVAANVSTRLLQLHLCTIYLFGGLSKARGQMWWDGTAMWYSVANYEYQSMDMTWIIEFPHLFTAMTHATLFWEIFYIALVWPRRTRPIALLTAITVHGGIAMFLGMITFGMMMIAANMIFVPPEFWLRLAGRQGQSAADADSEMSTTPESLAAPYYQAALEDRVEAGITPEDGISPEDGIASEEKDSQTGHGSTTPDQRPDVAALFPLEDAGGDRVGSDADLEPGSDAEWERREAELAAREDRLRKANRALDDKRRRLNESLDVYNERVERLKERETKINRLVERRRELKKQNLPLDELPLSDPAGEDS